MLSMLRFAAIFWVMTSLYAGGGVSVSAPPSLPKGSTPQQFTAMWSGPDGASDWQFSVSGPATIIKTEGASCTLEVKYDTPGEHEITVSCTAFWVKARPDGKPGRDSATPGSAKYKVVAITQFNALSDRFPKCVNDAISKDDFNLVVNFNEFYDNYVIDYPSGTKEEGSFTAKAHWDPDSKDVPYTVEGPNGIVWENSPDGIKTNDSGTGTYSEDPYNVYGLWFYEEFTAEWTLAKKSEFVQKQETEWTNCGGSIATSESTTIGNGGSFSVSFKKIISFGYSFSYSTSTSVTFGNAGIPRRRLAQRAYEQPIKIDTTLKKTWKRTYRQVGNSWVLSSEGPVNGGTTPGNDSGFLQGARTLGKQCCSG